MRLYHYSRWRTYFIRTGLLFIAAALLLGIAVKLSWQPLISANLSIYHHLIPPPSFGWVVWMLAFTAVGSFPFVTFYSTAAFAWLIYRRRFVQAAAWASGILAAAGLTELLKIIYSVARPAERLVATSGASFPSGHATAAAAFATLSMLCLIPYLRHRRVRGAADALAIVTVFLVALSRLALGAHWLTDVIGGALVGSGTTLVAYALFHWRGATTAPQSGG